MTLFIRYRMTAGLITLLTVVWVLQGFALLPLPASIEVTISFTLFLLPGGVLAHWVTGDKEWNWVRFVAFGFPISIGLLGLVSLPIRTLNLTMHHIAIVFYVLSVIGIVWAVRRYDTFVVRSLPQFSDRMTWVYSIGAIVIVLIFALLSPYTMRKTNDILLHSAEITQYASGTPLDWDEIYFDTGNQVWARVSLAIWRLAQGVLSWASDTHAFISQLTVSPLLILYLGVSIYVSARLFNLNERDSLLVVIIHFAFFTFMLEGAQAGDSILSRIIRDKILAGYAFTPIVLAVCNYTIRTRSWRSYLLFALILIGAIFTHPILTGFMILVIGFWMALNIVFMMQLRPFVYMILLCGVLFAPIVVIRFTTEQEFNFGEESIEEDKRIWLDEESQLYAISPDVAGGLTYALLIAVGVTSLIRIRRDELARFHLANVIVITLALIPLTAWVYGYFVSVYHINRALWILIQGLMVWYLFTTWSPIVLKRLPLEWKSSYTNGLGLLLLVGTFLSSATIINRESANIARSDEQVAFQQELIDIGEFVETQTDIPVYVTGLHDYIGAMSHVMKPVGFCNRRCMIAFTNITEDDARLRSNFAFRFHNFFDGYSNEHRVRDLMAYDVEYILLEPDNEIVESVFADYPEQFELVYQTASVNVVQFTPSEDG